MATVRKCWRSDCVSNVDGCYCDTSEIMIGTSGECLTYMQTDIYAKVEGFSRDVKEDNENEA